MRRVRALHGGGMIFSKLAAVCRLDRFGVTMTTNGPVTYEPGDFLVWSFKGEKFVCRGEKFLSAFPNYIREKAGVVA